MVDIVLQLISPLVMVAQVASIGLLVLLAVTAIQKKQNGLSEFINDHALWLAFVVALAATSGSLFYSEIMQYEPCKLCWLQRIFMYPQVILLGMAAWKKHQVIATHSIVLSVIGGSISFYHYLGQTTNLVSLSCGVVGQTVSCSKEFVLDYGYITIPLMALTAFVAITLLMISKKVYNK